MSKHEKSAQLDLGKYEVPEDLTRLYDALQAASSRAFQSVMAGETKIEHQWRLASRLCRQFLAATEEPAQLAMASRLGDWETARTTIEPPSEPYTYLLWLAAMAWRLMQVYLDDDDERHFSLIEPVRQFAREGITAAKTAPTLERVLAQRAAKGESRIEELERGPELSKSGKAPGVRHLRSV